MTVIKNLGRHINFWYVYHKRAATALPMHNSKFQWLLKDRFHVIYDVVVTSTERNSY
jgi:hypothetical protein